MSSGLRSATIKCVIVPTASAFSEIAMIKKSRGVCVRAIFDIVSREWICRGNFDADACSTTAFVVESQ